MRITKKIFDQKLDLLSKRLDKDLIFHANHFGYSIYTAGDNNSLQTEVIYSKTKTGLWRQMMAVLRALEIVQGNVKEGCHD